MKLNRSLPILAVLLTSNASMAKDMNTSIFGYIEGYYEKVGRQPQRGIVGGESGTDNGSATREAPVARVKNAGEFDTPHINTMVKSTFKDKYSAYLNLKIESGDAYAQNAWVENKIKGDHLKVRVGKMYRRFGLYNEQLDAVPTYIGIESPELFDGDHLLLTRTTNFMLHGEHNINANNTLKYALNTGNDERFGNEIPLGGDLRWTHFGSNFDLTIGTSFYYSQKAKPSKAMGAGSPDGGVVNWMREDDYKVHGIFTELNTSKLKFQFAYYKASHEAVRDGSRVASLTEKLNEQQISRICYQGLCSSGVDTATSYDVKTWYVRAGYTFNTSWGEVIPYVQWDYYKNPETIQEKSNGGDNEAGLADDGAFDKQTIGVVYRPIPVAAFKLDASNHSQTVDARDMNYSEIRFSYSYVWSL